MNKLIAAYLADPSLKNAQKIRAYTHKHPMARCLISAEANDTVARAIHFADCNGNIG